MIVCILLGLVVGTVMALTGAGGGILAVPLLVFGAHLGMTQAAPVGMLAIGMSAALGAVLGLRKKIVRYRAALLISAVGMVMSVVGVWLAARVDGRWLAILFSMVLALVAWRGFRADAHAVSTDDGKPRPPCVRDVSSGRFIWTTPCAQVLALAGGVAGLLSGLLGVGGGFVMVPALRRYTDLRMDSVIATSLAVIALVSANGAVSSLVAGRMDWSAAIPFCLGALAGMMAGRRVAGRLSEAFIQRAFAMMAGAVSLGMLVKILLAFQQ